MGARRRRARARAGKLGYGTAPVGSAGAAAHVDMVQPALDLYTPDADAGAVIEAQRMQATKMLNCPSHAKCDEQLGRNVYAYDRGFWKFWDTRDDSVVKVFDPSDPNSDAKREGELRAYSVLERLHTEKGALRPLWAEELTSRSQFDAGSLRIERYKPWRTLKNDPEWSDVSARSLVEHVAKMHENGIAHGDLSEDTIGFVGSAGTGRFVVSGSRQVVSPLSEFYEGKLSSLERGVINNLRERLGCKTEVGMPPAEEIGIGEILIHQIHRETDSTKRSRMIEILGSIIDDHNKFIGSMGRDLRALSGLFSHRLEKADPHRKHTLWTTLKYPGGAEVVVERPRAAERPRQEVAKTKTALSEVCPECEHTEIAKGGIHGVVYPYKGKDGKVVKVFKEDRNDHGKDERNALGEIRAYGILNKISASDPAFRSIKADRIPKGGGAVRIMIDRFSGVLDDYVPKDSGYAVNAKKMNEDGVSERDFRDLLMQFKILHRHGVAHGDAHGKNIGRLKTGGFVIVDPTWLKVSPLSELYDQHVEPAAKPVLDALRKATKQGSPTLDPTIYRYALNDEISSNALSTGISALLRDFDIAWSAENVKHASSFIYKHNKVVRAMWIDEKSDVMRLVKQFQNVEKIGEEWDFILPTRERQSA